MLASENRQRFIDDRRSHLPNVNEILEALEKTYGPQRATGLADPYEMIVYLNCGYPASDAWCSKGFDVLKREVGLSPRELLAAPREKLAKLLRLGGILPDQRAERLQEMARKVKGDYGGGLRAALKRCMQEEKQQPGGGVRAANKILREVPAVSKPTAATILPFYT